jgi:hypothetical protein
MHACDACAQQQLLMGARCHAIRTHPEGAMNQLAIFYYCIFILIIIRTVSYSLYNIMRYLWWPIPYTIGLYL